MSANTWEAEGLTAEERAKALADLCALPAHEQHMLTSALHAHASDVRRAVVEEAAGVCDGLAEKQAAYAKQMLALDAPDGWSLSSHSNAMANTNRVAAQLIRALAVEESK